MPRVGAGPAPVPSWIIRWKGVPMYRILFQMPDGQREWEMTLGNSPAEWTFSRDVKRHYNERLTDAQRQSAVIVAVTWRVEYGDGQTVVRRMPVLRPDGSLIEPVRIAGPARVTEVVRRPSHGEGEQWPVISETVVWEGE